MRRWVAGLAILGRLTQAQLTVDQSLNGMLLMLADRRGARQLCSRRMPTPGTASQIPFHSTPKATPNRVATSSGPLVNSVDENSYLFSGSFTASKMT